MGICRVARRPSGLPPRDLSRSRRTTHLQVLIPIFTTYGDVRDPAGIGISRESVEVVCREIFETHRTKLHCAINFPAVGELRKSGVPPRAATKRITARGEEAGSKRATGNLEETWTELPAKGAQFENSQSRLETRVVFYPSSQLGEESTARVSDVYHQHFAKFLAHTLNGRIRGPFKKYREFSISAG